MNWALKGKMEHPLTTEERDRQQAASEAHGEPECPPPSHVRTVLGCLPNHSKGLCCREMGLDP